MKGFLVFTLLFSCVAYADSFKSTIHSFEEGKPHLIKYDNGRVSFVTDEAVFEEMKRAEELGSAVEVKVSEKNDLLSVTSTELPVDDSPVAAPSETNNYTPTVLSSYGEASAIFSRMRRDANRRSQCYNRAHVWANEEFNRSGLKSVKLFLFFTNSYIRQYRFKWWFHVSPMVYAKNGDSTASYVIDRQFTRSPLSVKTWTDVFVYSKRTCPVVNRYSDYENHQESEHCYLIPVSMYFWQPRDIETYERTGREKRDFISSEVNAAYRQAFGW